MIKQLKDIVKSDFSLVGGKALNLAMMNNHGINVPDAFVITSKAYDEYTNENETAKAIDEILNSEMPLEQQSQRIKSLFYVEKISKKLRDEIMANLDKSKTYAVRSSATVEDLPDMSFAGQYSSYLNVSCDDIIEKVCLCWQSLYNSRAIEYRKKYSIYKDFSLCVVVQHMINSHVSGVVFTANPVTGIRDEIMINSAFGLGEAIVSGGVNPDTYRVQKSTGEIIETDIAVKEKMARYKKKGIEYISNPEDLKNTKSLSPKNIQDIVNQAKIIEDYFGTPQDIEFAMDKNGEIFIVQSREITTLYPIDNLKQDGKLRAYLVASSVMLAIKEAFTPLGADVYSSMFPTMITIMTAQKKPLSDDFVRYQGGRILLDLSYLLSNKLVAKQLGKAFSANDLPLKDTMAYLLEKHGKTFARQGIKFKIPFGFVKYGVELLKNMKEVRKVPTDQKNNAVKILGEQYFNDMKKKAQEVSSIEKGLDFCKKGLIDVFRLTQKQAMYAIAVSSYPKIEKTVKKLFGDRFNLDPLAYAFPDDFTVEMGLMLNKIAKYLDENKLQPSTDNEKVKEFMDIYGCRANVELDIGYERWSENPKYILDLIKSYMDKKMYKRNINDIYDKAKQAEDLTQEIYDAVKLIKGEKAANRIKRKIKDYRIAAGMREYPKFNIIQGLAIMRDVMIKQGEVLKQKDLIADAKDVFFIGKKDLLNNCDYKSIIAKNKEMYEREMKRSSIPRIVLNTGETFYSARRTDNNANTLRGIPLSPGIYKGKIKIVIDPNDANLKEGEIMVTESTNPAWTPLFMAAKGLIMEYGGPLSHGGIVAREYGIPSVVGISSVTKIFKDGQLVRVNGDSGIVEILD